MSQALYCLVVMSRAPVRGRVKTRLIPFLGSMRATRVYRLLLRATLEQVSNVVDMDVQIWGASTSGHIELLHLSHRYDCRRYLQPQGGLGRKMSMISSRLLQRYQGVIIVGSDCPGIDRKLIQQCRMELINGADVFLGVTEDGGYALIGLKQVQSALFRAMPWGTSRVANLTLKRARQLGLKVIVSEELWDVDTRTDFRRWLDYRRDQGWNQGKTCVI